MRLLAIAVLLAATVTAGATQVDAGDFSFMLPGEWELSTDDTGSTSARQRTSRGIRAFQVSIYRSASVEEGAKQLASIRGFLDTLEQKDGRLRKSTPFTRYRSTRAPFDYVAYTHSNGAGFFIGATLGSNAGNLLLTYEGSGDTETGIDELKAILETMTFRGN